MLKNYVGTMYYNNYVLVSDGFHYICVNNIMVHVSSEYLISIYKYITKTNDCILLFYLHL